MSEGERQSTIKWVPWHTWVGARLAHFFGPHLLPLLFSWVALSCVVALTLFVLYMTFVPGLPVDPGFTLSHWTELLDSYLLIKVIPNTVIVGVGTVLVTVFFAGPLAWLLNRTTLPFRNVFMALIATVVVVPGFVKAMGWIILVNERIGILNNSLASLLGLESIPISLNNPYGMAWVMGLVLTPSMFFLISGPMRALDPSLEEAAGVSGASRWWTFTGVSLPLIWPAILGGAIYNFMTAISIFEVPAMLGGASGKAPVLASELFYTVHPTTPDSAAAEIKYGAAGVYGVLIAAPSLLALHFYHRVLAKAHRYGVITGKGYRPRDVDLGRFKYAGLAFVLLYLSLAVVLPILVILWSSLLPVVQMPSVETLSKLSFRNYEDLLIVVGGPSVILNTIVLTVSVPFFVLFFSFMTSWIVVRTRIRGRGTMDTLAILPHAIPGLAFAFALFIVGLVVSRWMPWLPLRGTVAIIVIANVLNRLAYGTRITNAALLQVTPELEECARVCGASNVSVMGRVIAPLIKPSLIFAGLWTALLTFREVSMALFLTETKNLVLSASVWLLWRDGDMGVASAAATIMVAVTGVLMVITLVVAGARFAEPRHAAPIRGAG